MWFLQFLVFSAPNKTPPDASTGTYMAFPLEWEGWGRKQHILNENDPQHMKSVLARGLEGRRKDSPQPIWKVSPQHIA